MPQESSNRTGIRWLALTSNGVGVQFRGKPTLNVSVWPFTPENIAVARHTNELVRSETLTVNIDLTQAGVGGADSWSLNARPIDKYRLLAKRYRYAFRVQPVGK